MSKIITVAIIGLGGRGAGAYGTNMAEMKDKYKIAALCDMNPRKFEMFAEKFGVTPDNCFLDEKEFFEKKRADLLVIGTQDQDHIRMAVRGLELGYDILVEKPLADKKEELNKLLEAHKKYGHTVMVCHVLRYAPAFVKVDEILKSGSIGKLVAIDSVEQVWWAHQAHSFVRGNWRNSDETSPMIMAKCCHDMDLLQYYAGSKCKSISSIGDLTYFKAENAPEGAAERCLDCKYADTCTYSAKKFYIGRFRRNPDYSFVTIITTERPITEEGLMEVLRTGPYGRCVFHCDNNVVDHQMTIMQFENGVTANLTMTAFTGSGGRVMRFHGTLGEIVLNEDDDIIEIKIYGQDRQSIKISSLANINHVDGHGGGDIGIINGVYDALTGEENARTSLESSVESHLMCIAAEESRLAGGKLVYIH